MKRIHLVAGARPNFMKIGPVWHALKNHPVFQAQIVHTGQHYSPNMSDDFFSDLKLPQPDYHLGAKGDTHARQTASIMTAYEDLVLQDRPDCVVVVGDVNSTVAAALVAKKLELPLAHLEAGLRSFDRSLPEEINRLVTDSITDLFWTPSPDADANLQREGVPAERIDRVGNIMIDSLVMLQDSIASLDLPGRLRLDGPYVVVTLHRSANVDQEDSLTELVNALVALSNQIDVVFPVHPRTLSRLHAFDLTRQLDRPAIRLLEPLRYMEFMSLVRQAAIVVTDSGGVQEETSFLGIPCLTLRPNTERPITVAEGTNQLIEPSALLNAASASLAKGKRQVPVIDRWDGKAASRVVASLERYLLQNRQSI
jgi:UDP-N-acetylglucosamine 2-epimerase (non-hydrolysing)